MRTLLVLLILGGAFFGLPLLNGTALPSSFAPEAVGRFIGEAWTYWQTLFASAFRR